MDRCRARSSRAHAGRPGRSRRGASRAGPPRGPDPRRPAARGVMDATQLLEAAVNRHQRSGRNSPVVRESHRRRAGVGNGRKGGHGDRPEAVGQRSRDQRSGELADTEFPPWHRTRRREHGREEQCEQRRNRGGGPPPGAARQHGRCGEAAATTATPIPAQIAALAAKRSLASTASSDSTITAVMPAAVPIPERSRPAPSIATPGARADMPVPVANSRWPPRASAACPTRRATAGAPNVPAR